MIDPPTASLVSILGLLAQEPVTGFTAENVAARPELWSAVCASSTWPTPPSGVVLSVYLLILSIRLRRLSQQVRRLKERAGL